MANLTTETIEFKGTGAESLGQQYEKLLAESTKLKTQTAQLSQSLKDGSFVKQASDIAKATAELAKHRIEQRKVWDEGRRQVMQQRFGNTLGGGLYAAQKYGGRAMTAAGEIGGSAAGGALGLAAAAGGTLGYGSLVNRGFQGTAAAANLENQLDILARQISSSLMPEMNAMTRFFKDINSARERSTTGKGDWFDYAAGHIPEAAAIGGGVWGANKLSGGKLAAGGRAAGASRLGVYGLMAYGAYSLLTYNGYEDSGDNAPGKKEREEERKRNDRRSWWQRNFPNVSGWFGNDGGGPPGEAAALARRQQVGQNLAPGMEFVQGAGQKSSITAIYEELQESMGKFGSVSSEKGTLEEIRDGINELKDTIRGWGSRLGL